MTIPDQGKYQGVNPYRWMITLQDGREFTAASFKPRGTLSDVLASRDDIVRLHFIPGDHKFPRVSFYWGPGMELIFGVYHWKAVIEWFGIGSPDNDRPDPRRWTILIGWQNQLDRRRCVVGIDLKTGFLELQGN